MAGKEGWGIFVFIPLVFFSGNMKCDFNDDCVELCETHSLACFFLKEKSQTAELWEKLNFGNKDQNVKFRKLMGIKVNPVFLHY